MNKKRYARPTTELVVTGYSLMETFKNASVFKGRISPDTKFDDITVKEEDETKNLNIWDDKTKWGDD